jgi:hypothetical protein
VRAAAKSARFVLVDTALLGGIDDVGFSSGFGAQRMLPTGEMVGPGERH